MALGKKKKDETVDEPGNTAGSCTSPKPEGEKVEAPPEQPVERTAAQKQLDAKRRTVHS